MSQSLQGVHVARTLYGQKCIQLKGSVEQFSIVI